MMETILTETNRQGRRTHGVNYQAIDLIELKSFIGLLILRGVYRAAGESTEELWSPEHGRPVFGRTMGLNRFKLIRGILRFDNVETRQGRLARDRLAAVRLLLDSFVNNCQRAYVPGESLTIDEQLYPYRGRCRYIQYMPSKPAKYGLKFWLACDSYNYYCHNLQFYCGRDDAREPDVPLGEHVVLSLTEGHLLNLRGRNITCDNFFTSLSLANKLLERNMTLVGTMRANRRELPTAFTTHKGRELLSTIQATTTTEQGSTLLVSYMAKRNKVVNVLSTMHRKAVVQQDNVKRKTDVIQFYNATKGGVDAADERVGTYSVKFRARRWHVVVFCNILDLSAFNGFVVHRLFDPQWNENKSHRRRLYLLALGNLLIQEQVDRRQNNPLVIGARQQGDVAERGIKRGMCGKCPVGDRKKCTLRCHSCGIFMCKNHSYPICFGCSAQSDV